MGVVGEGVRLALDHLGAGHCWLTVLRALPQPTVKVDRSFVSPSARQPVSPSARQHVSERAGDAVLVRPVMDAADLRRRTRRPGRRGWGPALAGPGTLTWHRERLHHHLVRGRCNAGTRPVRLTAAGR